MPSRAGHWEKAGGAPLDDLQVQQGGGFGPYWEYFDSAYEASVFAADHDPASPFAGQFHITETYTFTWTHDSGENATNDPPPKSVIVHETASANSSNASLLDASGAGISPSAGATTGLPGETAGSGSSGPGYDGDHLYAFAGAGASGERWEVKDGSSGVVTVTSPQMTMSGSGGGSGCDMLALFDADVYSVTLGLNGTTKDDSGGDNILIGQGCRGYMGTAPATLSNFHWNVPGLTFDRFELAADQSSGHVVDVVASEWAADNPFWHWRKDDTVTVSCTADASIGGTSIGTVTGERQVQVWGPYHEAIVSTAPSEYGKSEYGTITDVKAGSSGVGGLRTYPNRPPRPQ